MNKANKAIQRQLPPRPPSNPFDAIHLATGTLFPKFYPPPIGPQLPLPLRPRLKPYVLKPEHRSIATIHNVVNHHKRLQRAQLYVPSLFDTISHTKHAKDPRGMRSSRVVPHTLNRVSKSNNEYWKHGYRLPLPSPFAFGATRPCKPLDLTVKEWRFRHIHPQFNVLFDKWLGPGVNLSDPKNLQLMREEIMIIIDTMQSQRGQYKNRRIHRPDTLEAFRVYYEYFIHAPRQRRLHREQLAQEAKEAPTLKPTATEQLRDLFKR